jgi:transcriptional regulator with XRE-family HTH domain
MQKPYQKLGEELKDIRQKHHESMAEVSGAVEIDIDFLERIEVGQERPSEDLLMLLISHFDIDEEESLSLWQAAGYYFGQAIDRSPLNNDLDRSVLVMMALDSRVLYSDNVEVSADKKGVVVNFLQQGTSANQQVPIARIGMSHEQAKDLLQSLHQSLVNVSSQPAQKRLMVSKQRKIPKSKKSKSKT